MQYEQLREHGRRQADAARQTLERLPAHFGRVGRWTVMPAVAAVFLTVWSIAFVTAPVFQWSVRGVYRLLGYRYVPSRS